MEKIKVKTAKGNIQVHVIKVIENTGYIVSKTKKGKKFFVTDKDPATVTGATVVELTASGWEAKVSATSEYAGVAFKILRKEDMIFASGSILSEEVDAWFLECTNN